MGPKPLGGLDLAEEFSLVRLEFVRQKTRTRGQYSLSSDAPPRRGRDAGETESLDKREKGMKEEAERDSLMRPIGC